MKGDKRELMEKEAFKRYSEIFYDTAKHLAENPTGVRGGSIPILYLLAHSFELLFKAYLMELNGNYPQGHNLIKISEKIEAMDPSYKDFIDSPVNDPFRENTPIHILLTDGKEYSLKSYRGYVGMLSSYVETNGGIRYPRDFAFDFNIFPITEKIYNYIYEKIQ
jgi:hypothetical protein